MNDDVRAAKLALARKKLKDHQKKKINNDKVSQNITDTSNHQSYTNNTDTVYHLTTDNTIDGINNEHTLNKLGDDMFKNKITQVDECITDLFIPNKEKNFDTQIKQLQSRLFQLESDYNVALMNEKVAHQNHMILENKVKDINDKYMIADEEIKTKNKVIENLNLEKLSLCEDNSNLMEKLELTKNILATKETENLSLQFQINTLKKEHEVIQLQLEQLTNGTSGITVSEKNKHLETQQINDLTQNIFSLKQQLQSIQKEKEQASLYYEHYINEINEQLNSVIHKNQELTIEVQRLSDRENTLVDQIRDMEIRLQNCNQKVVNNLDKKDSSNNDESNNELPKLYDSCQQQLQELRIKHNELQKAYTENVNQLKALQEIQADSKDTENNDFSIITKLNSDITSCKVAAQRATEQNKKLKTDLKDLEEAFIKVSKDKLELTEKVAAEKYLNRELTLKLAEINEKAQQMNTQLKAKDQEMIRLQTNYRNMEEEYAQFKYTVLKQNEDNHKKFDNINDIQENKQGQEIISDADEISSIDISKFDSFRIPRENAMIKLQERFLKIMNEVADLSDEKQRLEHIILQLQNETDTICEYIALYQQQRSILNKRDEERNAQIKLFESECIRLKSQLEEINDIIIKFASDDELYSYFQMKSKQNDIVKVKELIMNMKTNCLVDPNKINLELKLIHSCNCCSGKLIDV